MRNIRYPTIEQSSINDCGASCLYMILKYYGGFETLDNLKELTHTKKEGTTFFELKEAAISLGFDVSCYHVNEIKKDFAPFIAHVRIDDTYYHYIVVYKVFKNKVLVADPEKGILEYWSMKKFNRVFEGNIMLLYPSHPLYRNKHCMTISKMWTRFLKINKKILKKIILISTVSIFMELILMTSFYSLLMIAKAKNIHLLLYVSIFFIGVIFFKNMVLYIRNKLLCYVEINFENDLKEKRWRSILNLPYRDLNLKNTGEITLSLEKTNEISQFYLKFLLFIAFDLVTFLLVVIILFFLKKECIYIVLLYFLEAFTLSYLFKKQRREMKKYAHDTSSIKQIEDEIKESIISLKNTNLECKTLTRLKKYYHIYKKQDYHFSKKIILVTLLQNMMKEVFSIFIQTSLLILLIYQNQNIEMSILIFQLTSFLNGIIENFLELTLEKEKIKVYLESYLLKTFRISHKDIHNLQFKNMKFQEFSKLNNISFKLRKKDKILLFGKSGIGKSTLMNIIKGNYQVNNFFINEQESHYFNRKVCYVTSKPFMYTGSLIENIEYERNLKKEEISKIMTLLHINENKINRNINFLSSGEKQKISLARALFSEFDLLILDECLNQIDEKEEVEIMQNILKEYESKMMIVISHRTNLKDLFPKIAVLTNHGQLKFLKRKEKICLEESLETYLKY